MQYYSSVLIPLSATSALDVPKYTKNKCTHTLISIHPPTHHAHTSSFAGPQRMWSTLISGAVLPCPCSFIAALYCGGVSLCPDRQSVNHGGEWLKIHLKQLFCQMKRFAVHSWLWTWKDRVTILDHGVPDTPHPPTGAFCCSLIPSLPWLNPLSSPMAFHSISAVLDTMSNQI